MMSNILALAPSFVGGMLLGGIFFGALWWSVRRGIRSAAPALWFSASWLIRTAVALAGFYVISHGEWPRLVACLLGFVLARGALLRLNRRVTLPETSMVKSSP
jgi:F1F0 ATPase subunit 2